VVSAAPWRSQVAGSNARVCSDEPFLGIDHTALSVSSSRRSLAFYRLWAEHCGGDRELGPAQSRLDGLVAAHVRVTTLRPAAPQGRHWNCSRIGPGRACENPSVSDLPLQWTTLSAVAPGPATPTTADAHRRC